MKKIKLILPLIGLTTLVSTSVPLICCKNGDTKSNALCFVSTPNDGKPSKIGYELAGGLTLNTIECKMDNGSWKSWDGSLKTLKDGHKFYVRNKSSNLSTSGSAYFQFKTGESTDGFIEASGNVHSMINYSSTCNSWCFYNLFASCSRLLKSPQLPAVVLAEHCYENMFYNCGSLTTVSTIATPAPTHNNSRYPDSCYKNMFSFCSHLYVSQDIGNDDKLICNIPDGEISIIRAADGMFNGTPGFNTVVNPGHKYFYYWLE